MNAHENPIANKDVEPIDNQEIAETNQELAEPASETDIETTQLNIEAATDAAQSQIHETSNTIAVEATPEEQQAIQEADVSFSDHVKSIGIKALLKIRYPINLKTLQGYLQDRALPSRLEKKYDTQVSSYFSEDGRMIAIPPKEIIQAVIDNENARADIRAMNKYNAKVARKKEAIRRLRGF